MITSFCLLAVITVAGDADEPMTGREKPTAVFEAFTEPFRTVEICASESGRLAKVSIRRGDSVEADQPLMQLDDTILMAQQNIARQEARSSARLDALIVEMKVRQNRLNQVRELLNDGAGSHEEVKRAEADAAVAKLNVDAGRETQQLAELRLSEINARLRQRQIRSPIDGLIVDVLKESGEYVSASAPHVATVVQLEQLRATFYVPTGIASRLSQESSLQLQVQGRTQPITAQTEYVAAITNADSGRVRVDVLIDNSNLAIRSGLRCVLTIPSNDATAGDHDHDA